ncbi:MAG: glycosyltransferase family A protein [Muribaculaceae bacterium]
MDITIILPVYNRAHLVGATLDSIAAQTIRPLHLILIDNNSSDNTLQVLLDFKKRKQANDFCITVLQETRRGAAAARNCGLQEAKSEWVMFFDSDDLMASDLLESYALAAEKHPDADIITTCATLKQLDGGTRMLPFFEKDFFANHLIHSTLATQRYIARRKCFVNVGGWDPSQMVWNDLELGVRLLLQMPTLAFVNDKSRITVIANEQSISGVDFSSRHEGCEHALDTIEKKLMESAHPQAERLIKIVDYRRVNLAAHYACEGHHELAAPLYGKVIRKYVSSPVLSTLFGIGYDYIRCGGRGFGRLIRLIVR